MLSNEQLLAITKEIEKTGFPFEYEVASAFEKQGWVTISSKFYLDDVHQIPREIDLIAYKSSKVEHLNIFTAIVVSCKKSDENAWALLSKPADLSDPNTDWWPVNIWTNDRAINFEIDQPKRKETYYNELISKGVRRVIEQPTSNIFAFQEMKVSSGKPQNDKTIFSSINSLLQAQAYELGVLHERKKSPSVYQFNLLSVVDGEMIRIDFGAPTLTARNVDYEHYVSRYIVKKKQVFSKILFLHKKALEDAIANYERMHQANCAVFKEMYDEFFVQVLKDGDRRKLYLEDFRNKIRFMLSWVTEREFSVGLKVEDIDLAWHEEGGVLMVLLNSSSTTPTAEELNGNEEVKKIIRKALSQIYKYSGEFSFEMDIPF